jgi:hypothetical protein
MNLETNELKARILRRGIKMIDLANHLGVNNTRLSAALSAELEGIRQAVIAYLDMVESEEGDG